MENLVDPLNDRMVKTVKPPPHRPLDPNLMYPDPGKNTDQRSIVTIFHSQPHSARCGIN